MITEKMLTMNSSLDIKVSFFLLSLKTYHKLYFMSCIY